MGAGIAEVCARAGLDVMVAETTGEALEIGRTRLFNSLAKATERGKITEEELEATQARLSFTTDLGEFADRDLVIEAVVENEQVKTEIFQVLDQVVTRPDAILASNTSSIPLVKLAVATARPDQVIGIHFFNPAPVQKLVELIPALTTSEGTISRAQLFTEKLLGKHAIRAQDRSGFVVNALLIPYLLSAIRMFETGIASREDIDNGTGDSAGRGTDIRSVPSGRSTVAAPGEATAGRGAGPSPPSSSAYGSTSNPATASVAAVEATATAWVFPLPCGRPRPSRNSTAPRVPASEARSVRRARASSDSTVR